MNWIRVLGPKSIPVRVAWGAGQLALKLLLEVKVVKH